MDLKAVIFDVNGCLVDILTDDGRVEVFRKMRDFLYYQGVYIHKTQLRELYFQLLKQQQLTSREKHVEFNGEAIWGKIIQLHESPLTRALSLETRRSLPVLAAQVYRSLTLCKKLCVYPGVQNTLDILRLSYRLGVVTDAQSAYAVPELAAVGLAHYFDPIIVSGDHGFRKPDRRLFEMCLDRLQLKPENAIYVGNDMYRDVYGAKQAGLNVVYFSSNQGNKEPHDSEPDYVINEFSELLLAIEFIKKRDAANSTKSMR